MSLLETLSWFTSSTVARKRARLLAQQDLRLMQELVKVRIARGLSQSQVAELLGVTQQAVSKLERPGADPRLSRLRQYSHAIGALVGHAVESDDGQLERGDWVVYSYSTPASVAPASNTYQVAFSKRTDFFLAA